MRIRRRNAVVLSIVAVVGESMRERPGIAGRIFRILGEQRINVRAIAQGSSELNISLVISARIQANSGGKSAGRSPEPQTTISR